MFSPIQADDPGRDGAVGTADDQKITVYTLNPGFTLVDDLAINDDRLGVKYNGLEIVGTKRYGRGTTLLAGYTYSRETVEQTSLANPNAALVNADGLCGGRRHNFKVSGSATLPYRLTFGANLVLSSGLPITRSVNIPGCTRDGHDRMPVAGRSGRECRAARQRRAARPLPDRPPDRAGCSTSVDRGSSSGWMPTT